MKRCSGFVRFVACVLLVGGSGFAQQASGETFSSAGTVIYYEVLGKSAGTPPLVVVNGGPGFDHTYLLISPVWQTIAKSRRVVFYDQRGTGRSPAPKNESYTLVDNMEDLDALRAQLGAERLDLLGHSWGGFLAMAYAARHPEHVSHLLLVDSAAPKLSDTVFLFKDVFPDVTAQQAGVAFAKELGEKAAINTDLHEYLSMLFYSQEKRDAFIAQFSPAAYHKDVEEAVWKDASRFDLTPELRKFSFPTAVFTGRFDMNVAPSVAYKINEQNTGSRLVIFERSGHLPFYEEPDRFSAVLDEFLK